MIDPYDDPETRNEDGEQIAARLSLPDPPDWTVNEAEEARTCTGCEAWYDDGVRWVAMVPGCPAHHSEAANA